MEQNEQVVERDANPVIGVRLPDHIRQALKAQAKHEMASVQTLIRRAVAEFLARQSAA